MSSAPVVPTVTERTLLSGPWIALGMSVGALALVATTVAVWPEPSFPPSEIVTLTFDGGLKQHPKLSPDGARVAFDWGGPEGDNRDIYVKTVGPDTFAQRLTTHPAEELGAGWSPDGSRLAFFRVANERAAIHLIPASGGDAEKLVDMEGPYRPLDRPRPGPLSWSPDGRYLVTAQRASATAPARVVVVDIETRQIRAITDPEAAGATIGDIGPSFSPDGRWIAFARGEARHGSYDVWVIDASGEQPERRVTSRRWLVFHDLSWHPNGQEILLSAGTHSIVRSFRVDIGEGVPLLVGGGLGDNNNSLHAVAGRLVYRRWVPANWGLWVGPGRLADDPDAEPRLFLDTFAFEGHQAHSPDSSQIAFRSDRTGQAQIWVANRDGSNPRQLTFLETGADVPTWGPNGLIVFGTQEAGNNDIWTVDVETRVVRPVTSYEGLDDFPVFSPDGQYIYFSSDRSSAMQIHRIPVGGGPPVDQITRQGGDVPIVWGDYVYYATSTGNVSIWRVPLEGGEEAEVLAGPIFSVNWGIAGDGLYYHARGGVHRHDLVTGETMQLFSGGGLWHSVSPDEKDVMFRRGTPQSAELFVLENFR